MHFILTTVTEKELSKSPLLNDKHYKFIDVEILRSDFEEDLELKDSKYVDLHFSQFLTLKLQNNFKSSRSEYFIYRVPVMLPHIVENMKSFVESRYESRLNNIWLIDKDIESVYNSLDDVNGMKFVEYSNDSLSMSTRFYCDKV